jgi:hypothetical protein
MVVLQWVTVNATTDPTPKGWQGRWKLPLGPCPALHFVTALQLPKFPGLSVKSTPMVHLTHGVAGFASWSVVPAAHLRSAHDSLVEPLPTKVPSGHLAHLPFSGAQPASHVTGHNTSERERQRVGTIVQRHSGATDMQLCTVTVGRYCNIRNWV